MKSKEYICLFWFEIVLSIEDLSIESLRLTILDLILESICLELVFKETKER